MDIKARSGLRKKGLLDVGATPVWGDENDIETRGEIRKLRMFTQENLSGGRDAGLLPRKNRPRSLLVGPAALHLDEGDVIAALCNKVDLTALGFVALCQDAIVLAFKEASGPKFGCDAAGLRILGG